MTTARTPPTIAIGHAPGGLGQTGLSDMERLEIAAAETRAYGPEFTIEAEFQPGDAGAKTLHRRRWAIKRGRVPVHGGDSWVVVSSDEGSEP